MRQLDDLLKEIKIKNDFDEENYIVPMEELYRSVFGGIDELDIAEQKKGVFIAQSSIDKFTFNTNSLEFKAVGFAPDIFAPEDEDIQDIQEWEREINTKELLDLLKKWGFNF